MQEAGWAESEAAHYASVAKLANAPDLESGGSGLEGSTPSVRTEPGWQELVDAADLNSAVRLGRPGPNPGPGTNGVDTALGELDDQEPDEAGNVEGHMEDVRQTHHRIVPWLS